MKRVAVLLKRDLPRLNAPLIIQRLSAELALPSDALSSALVLHELIPLEDKQPERLNDRSQVLAYLIIAMKILYGFGDYLDYRFARKLVR
jgi:hypothetical protein